MYETDIDSSSFNIFSLVPEMFFGFICMFFLNVCRLSLHGIFNLFQSQTDIVLGYVDQYDSSVLYDGWVLGYQGPSMDSQQNIINATIKREDGIVTMDFLRPRKTPDDNVSTNKNVHFSLVNAT